MEQFDIAFGHCTVRDGVLGIDRPDLEEMGRWEVFRTELRMGVKYRPWATGAWIGAVLVSGLIFVALLVYLYASNLGEAPLVGGLGLFGLLGVGGSFELKHRREVRERRRLRTALADEFSLARPSRLSLDDISGVTVRPVSTRRFLGDGYFFLVHFRHDGEEATTSLGFPKFMDEQMDTARTVFERHDIPVTDDEER